MVPVPTPPAQVAPLLASNVAFGIIFGIFVAALLVLIVVVVTWAIRSDRKGRMAWRQRQAERAAAGERDTPPAPPHDG